MTSLRTLNSMLKSRRQRDLLALALGLIVLAAGSPAARGADVVTAATTPRATSQAEDASATTAPAQGSTTRLIEDLSAQMTLKESTVPPAAGTGPDLTALSLEDLMSIEVTSVSKTRQRLADAPAAVTVITQDDIRRSGLHQIPEILRLSPGLFVQRGTVQGHWTVASRGLAYDFNNSLLVLQDGRTLYTPVYGGVAWDTVDYVIADLDRIEVIRGPGATLWGANAVNGVINITTKDARDTQGVLLETRASTDVSDFALRYGGQLGDDTYYRVFGKGTYSDDLATVPGEDAQLRYHVKRGGFRVDHHASAEDVLTLQGEAFDLSGESEMQSLTYTPPFRTLNDDDRTSRGGHVLGRWTRTVGSSEYALQVYVDRLAFESPFTAHDLNTFDTEFQHHFHPAEGHEVTYGFNARFQLFDSRRAGSGVSPASPLILSYTPEEDELYTLSTFVQDTLTLVPERLKLTVGSKFEYNDFTGFEIEPSARLVWTPNERNSVWAGVSRAVRTPGMDNRAFRLPVAVFPTPGQPGTVNEVLFRGNPDVDSEELLAFELGYRKQVTEAWSIDIAGFLNEHDNLIVAQGRPPVFVPTPVPHLEIASVDINGASVESYGTEISTSLSVTENWRLTGSYTLLISHVVDTAPNVNLAGTFYESPRHQFQLHSYYDITPKLQLNTSLYCVGSSHGDAVPAYARLDVNLTWTPEPGLALQVGIQNAIDPEHGEVVARNGARTEVERAAYAQLTWSY